MKKKILKILRTKNKKSLVCLTAYSKPIAKILDKYCDIVLVGDSLATAMYGMKNTHQATLEMMIQHGISVKSNLSKALCVIDMPKNTYRNINEAKKNVKLVFKKTKCDAIKMECNGNNFKIIKSIVKLGFPVMGHIGFTPQYYKKFKIQGLKEKDRLRLIREAIKNEEAGVFSIVLECVTNNVAKEITQSLKIPTVGIGSSINCDGQILVTDDMLGLSSFYPKFVKKFVKLTNIIEKAVQKYNTAVLTRKFPSKKNNF
ncbi:MAG: 3-methyl-2-oxobutanoate hydroxymethyltransferase [Pelagibacteraceae bacterium]|nr:3-methyl-2-oxobutanoate hydroxymethyltransferase [Pelagibacteraceae bacterium]